jgi:hypothetical protein
MLLYFSGSHSASDFRFWIADFRLALPRRAGMAAQSKIENPKSKMSRR